MSLYRVPGRPIEVREFDPPDWRLRWHDAARGAGVGAALVLGGTVLALAQLLAVVCEYLARAK